MTTPSGSFLRTRSLRIAHAIRDVWLIAGATIALIVLADVAFRLVRIASRSVSGAAPQATQPANPFDTVAWASDYRSGRVHGEDVQWASYVYLRNPTFRSAVISTDSLGHRVMPAPAAAGTRVRVLFFGGSTTFGWYQRDEQTIPMEASRRLQAVLGARGTVEATNFGVPGRIFTQEILDLILQLRAGTRPDVVMFYDGINDVMATLQDGQAGLPQNEANRVEDFARGRRVVAENLGGLGNDVRATARAAASVLGRLQFVRTIREGKPAPALKLISADSAVRSIVQMYAGNARVVEALAAAYGFEVVYVWQPTLLSTTKPLTAREKFLVVPAERDSMYKRMREVHVAVPPLLRAAMTPIAGSRFIEATPLFSDDSLDVYVDIIGHTYERANPRIVDAILPTLGAALTRAISPSRRAAAPPSAPARE